MRDEDCTYELYLAYFKDARAALKAGDAARLAALRVRATARGDCGGQAALLALADAEARSSKRSKFDVCRPLCTTRCERGV